MLCPADGVEDGEEFAGGSDDGEEFGFAGGDEPVAERFEGGVEPGGDHGAHEQGGAYSGAAAADEAAPAPLARLAGVGCQANQRGDLAAIEPAQFGQFGEQRARDGLANAGD